MIRAALSAGLVALWVGAGLAAAFQQSGNLARGRRLADLQRRCEMLEAAAGELEARVLAHVPGVDDTRDPEPEPEAEGPFASAGRPTE